MRRAVEVLGVLEDAIAVEIERVTDEAADGDATEMGGILEAKVVTVGAAEIDGMLGLDTAGVGSSSS